MFEKEIKEIKEEFNTKFIEAMKSEDSGEAVATAISNFSEKMQSNILQEAESKIKNMDNAVIESRGGRVLTSAEQKYYTGVLEAMKGHTPKQSLDIIDEVLPLTVIERVFEDIQETHPLLDVINFQNTGALTRILLGTSEGVSAWGALCSEINEEIEAGFTPIELTAKKLSAYMPVCKDMLELGPVWLDRYVRAILAEALAVGLEYGILMGDGKDGPIGMARQLTVGGGGVYPLKTVTTITDFLPTTIGGLLADISEGPNGKSRVVPELLLVVNPADYYTKVYPATTVRGTNGTFANNALPYPIKVVQSGVVPAGKAIAGLASRYFMGLGTGKEGRITFSDDYKFLEDIRIYAIKLYGQGQALDENAFKYLDISGLEPANIEVKVISDEVGTEG